MLLKITRNRTRKVYHVFLFRLYAFGFDEGIIPIVLVNVFALACLPLDVCCVGIEQGTCSTFVSTCWFIPLVDVCKLHSHLPLFKGKEVSIFMDQQDQTQSMGQNQDNQTMNPRKLFVGNLSWNLTSDDLRETFGEFGTVEEAIVLTDKFSGRSKGFGFVTMSTEEEAQAAIEGLHQKEVDGRQIVVNVAQPPRPREERRFNDRGGDRGGDRRGGNRGGYNRGPRRDY